MSWLPVLFFGLFGLGFAATGAFVLLVPAADALDAVPVELALFEVLYAAVGGYALAAAAYFACWLVGACRLAGLVRLRTLLGWALWVLAVAGILFGALFAVTANAPASIDRSLAQQSQPVTVVVALCLAPGLMGFLALRHIAARPGEVEGPGSGGLALVSRLRAELRRLLNVLGGFLTLLVVTTGTRRSALLAFDHDLHLPVESVLLYGGVFAVLLGAFFVLANTAIDTRATRLLDDVAPLPDPRDPQSSEVIRRRADLAGVLGLESSRRTFESTVVVAAPLLSALIAGAIGS